jgi:hypothetical protein
VTAYNDTMTAARSFAPVESFAPFAPQAGGPATNPQAAFASGNHGLLQALARRIAARTGAPVPRLLDAGATALDLPQRDSANTLRDSAATTIRRAMFASIRNGVPGQPPQQLQRALDAYRATLQTMATIEAGGSGDDDGDFRRLMADVAEAARTNPAGAHLNYSIANVVAGFPSREQIILQLSLVDNCSIAEIAAILDINPGSAAQIRRAAIGRLRHELACLSAG